jgi:hypothetical protein
MKPNEFGRLGLIALFGHMSGQLEKMFARYGKNGAVVGTDYDAAAKAIIGACTRRGYWDPFSLVRGAGAWRGDDGELILHAGDAVSIDGEWHEAGKIGRHVYPSAKAGLRPWDAPVAGGARGAGQKLLTILRTWNWKRGDLDAHLLLGWIGAAFIGGALQWRPVVWVSGGRGTGKSTLNKLLEHVFGGAMIAVSDASAAGVWQKLGHASLPVLLDEMEAEDDPRRGQALIKFARQAASGGLVLRGGADHGASEFTARSCFMFSSILVPPLLAQDRSRMAILELGELTGQPAPEIDARDLGELGRRLLRRLADGWSRWPDTLAMYRAALEAAGHSARGADVFGTMLAAADVLLHDGDPHRDHVDELAQQLNVQSLAEAEDDARDEESCLQHLLTQTIPLDGTGSKRPVAEWIRRAAGLSPTEDEQDGGATGQTINDAKTILGRYGLSVKALGEDQVLYVASRHAELGKLFAGTHWAGRSGSVGVWTQTLRRIRGAHPSGKTVWFTGASAKATMLPIADILTDPEPGDLPRGHAGAQFRFGKKEW